ncbi:YDG domain-containing protein [Paenibacillus puerhi]|uniref:YDG domain-containing protein n=1 Tax=Paenibacillus puerhi TaxID=2692622 RepID=UPI00135AA7EA|nr:YDG domain-containing protein [Paenibacillus puerhi]
MKTVKNSLLSLFTMLLLFTFYLSVPVSSAASTVSKEVVFIDSSIEDAQLLADQASRRAEVIWIGSDLDGIKQISDALAGRKGLDAIHLITHGAPGEIVLGGNVLSEETVDTYRAELAAVGHSLRAGGDVLIYGCEVAQSGEGYTFLEALSRMIGADIAASEDRTSGNPLLGNAVLEAAIGGIETQPVDMSGWNGVLPNASKTVGVGQEVSLTSADLGYQDYSYVYFDSVPGAGSQLGLGTASNSIGVGFSYPKTTVDSNQIKFRGNAAGVYTFKVSWSGGQGLVGDKKTPHTSSFTITITVVNPPPTNIQLISDKAPAGYPGMRIGKLIGTDIAGDQLTFSVKSDPANLFSVTTVDASQKLGLLSLRAGKSLALGENANVTLTVTDQLGQSFDKAFTITGVAPQILNLNSLAEQYFEMTEEVRDIHYLPAESGKGTLYYVDDEDWYGGGNVDLQMVINDAPLMVGERVMYRAPAASGTDSFILGSKYYVVLIGSQNTSPSFVGAATVLTVNQNSSAVDVRDLLKVSDPDTGQTLTWSLSTAPSHGTMALSGTTAASGNASITPGGTITYTPANGYYGADTFTVQVSDGIATTTRTISVNVAAVPVSVVTQPSGASVNAGGSTSFSITATGTVVGYQWQVNSGSGFVNITNGGVYSGATTNTLSITGATAGMHGYQYRVVVTGASAPSVTSNSAALTVNVALGQVGNVQLSAQGIASWNDLSNELGYQVQLYNNGVPVGSAVSKTANSTSHDFLSDMRSFGEGSYTVRVTAKGNGVNIIDGAASAASAAQTVIRLSTVSSGLVWVNKTANWQATPQAISYDVQLFKDNVAIGAPINVTGANQTAGVDFTASLAAPGTYTFRVTPKGGGLILDGAQSALSSSLIQPIALTVTGVTASSKTYDNTTAAAFDASGAVLNGILVGDEVTLNTASAAAVFDNKNVGTGKTVTVNGLVLAGAQASKYVLTDVVLAADIIAKPVTLHDITASGKDYDGSAGANIQAGTATISGIIPGDQVTLNVSQAAGAFVDKQVGSGKTVAVSGLALTGADAGNYALQPYSTTADITVKTVAVTGITASGKAYDGQLAAALDLSAAVLSGAVASDQVALDVSQAAGVFSDKHAGSGKTVAVSGLALTGADAGNYALQSYSTTADITVKTVAVTGITASSKAYDGQTAAALDVSAAGLNGAVAGDQVVLDVSQAAGAFADKQAGSRKTVAVSGLSLTGVDAGNYAVAAYSMTADITAIPVTLTGITAGSKVYDGQTAARLDASAAVLSGAVAGDQVALDVSQATGAFPDKQVGSGKTVSVSGLALTGVDAGNYALQPYSTTADITVKTVAVTGITASGKEYDGQTAAALDVSAAVLSGAVAGDQVALDSSMASGAFDNKHVGANKTVAITGLSIVGADANNYILNPGTAASASVTAKPLTVSGISAVDKTYDGTTAAVLHMSAAAVDGVIPGDEAELNISSATGSFGSREVGTTKAVTVSGLSLNGADAGNYELLPYTSTAGIEPKTISAAGIQAVNRAYDGTVSAALDLAAASLTGVEAGDAVSLNTSLAAAVFASADAGTGKSVAVMGLFLEGADAGNYSLSPYTTQADITVLALSVTGITANDKLYDGTVAATFDASAAVLNGIVAGDEVSLVTASAAAAFDSKHAAAGKTVTISGLALSGRDAAKYSVPVVTTTAGITQKSVSISGITVAPKTYDGTTSAALAGSGSLQGIKTGDRVELSGTAVGSYEERQAGADKVINVSGLSLSGADAGNYSLTPLALLSTITVKPVSAAGITAVSKFYDGTSTVALNKALAHVSGAVPGDSVVLDTSGATGSFASGDIGTGIPVSVSGLILTGADSANYLLTPYSTAADIRYGGPTGIDHEKQGMEDAVVRLSVTDFVYSTQTGRALHKIKVVTLPAHGLLKLNGSSVTVSQEVYAYDLGNLTFEPDADWSGIARLMWEASDGSKYYAQAASLDIRILPVNDAPVASNGIFTTNAGEVGTGVLTARDVEGDPLTYHIVAQGGKGTVVLTDPASGAFEYSPHAGQHGPDSFTFKVSDGLADSNTAVVQVTIIPSGVADLRSLSAGNVTLTPEFAANSMNYSANVSNSVYSLSVTATVYNPHSTVKINGHLVIDAGTGVYTHEVDLEVGVSTHLVEVTAQDGRTTKTYSIRVDRAPSSNASLSGLTASAGSLTPVFDSGQYAYTVQVEHHTDTIRFQPVAADTTSVIRINGALTSGGTYSGDLALHVGSNAFNVEVTAQDGITRLTYALTVYRDPSANAKVKGIAVSGATLNPAFDAEVAAYNATVSYSSGSIAITPELDDPTATVSINGQAAAHGAATAVQLRTGANVITVEVTAQDGTTKRRYTLSINRLEEESDTGGDGPSDPGTPAPQPGPVLEPTPEPSVSNPAQLPTSDMNRTDGEAEIIVNGVRQGQAGVLVTEAIAGRTVTRLVADHAKWNRILNQQGNKPVVIVPINNSSGTVSLQLTGDLIHSMETRGATLILKTEEASYSLGAHQINLSALTAHWGSGTALQDVMIDIRITKSSQETVHMLQSTAQKEGYSLVAPPLDFTVQASYRGQTMEVSRFDAYVERHIRLPEEIDPGKITTGVVHVADGVVAHVPTAVSRTGSQYFAKINSLTNSTYSVIYNPRTMEDVESHWSKIDVNDMASRMIVNGYDDKRFKPDDAITRAEFAAILVKAMALRPSGSQPDFDDVKAGAWYVEAVSAAHEYGIISGYDDGSFKPERTITREEAMAMIAKAMRITKLDTVISESDIHNRLAGFKDNGEVSEWAKAFVALCIRLGIVQGDDTGLSAKESISRAETAAIVRRMLLTADLIHDVTKEP